MSREIVNFTYDVPFVIATAVKILCEKELYDSRDDSIVIENKIYNRDDVKKRYASEVTKENNLLDTKALTWMEKVMPAGGTIDVPQLTAVKELFLKELVRYLPVVDYFKSCDARDRDSYVECKAPGMERRIYCDFGEHVSALYILLADYFGIDDLLKGTYTKHDIADYVHCYITISSSFTLLSHVIHDIDYFGLDKTQLHFTKMRIMNRKEAK